MVILDRLGRKLERRFMAAATETKDCFEAIGLFVSCSSAAVSQPRLLVSAFWNQIN